NGLPAGVNVRDRTAPEFRALEQVERSVPHFNAGSRPPNEPAPHDMRMERAHEYSHPPERNAATDQPVAQLCQHFVSLHRRACATNEPIHKRSYVVGCHPTAAL